MPRTRIEELESISQIWIKWQSGLENVTSKGSFSTVIGGGTGFLIREPFTQLSTFMSHFCSFELSSVTLKLPQSEISFFNIYCPPSSSSFSKPFSLFFWVNLTPFSLSPHEFVTTGDFNIHLDNSSDHATSQFLSVLSSFNLIQNVNFQTHSKNHILDLVIILPTPLLPHLYPPHCALHLTTSPFSLNYLLILHHCPLQRNIYCAAYTLCTMVIFFLVCCHPPL